MSVVFGNAPDSSRLQGKEMVKKTRLLLTLLVLFGVPAGIWFISVQSTAHGSNWRKFLDRLSGGESELFCNEHGVPEAYCTLCHQDLLRRLVMCREHGVPEAICTVCHPDAEQQYGLKMICPRHHLPQALCPACQRDESVSSDWCQEHGVPESLCVRCQPELTQSLPMCREHGVPEAVCTVCRPDLAQNFTLCEHRLPAGLCVACDRDEGASPVGGELRASRIGSPNGVAGAAAATADLPRVRLAGPDIAGKIGLELKAVSRQELRSVVAAAGEVEYDQTRYAHVRPRVSGIIRGFLVKPGDTVTRGQVLAVIDSAELGQAKADYLAAMPLVELWTQTLSRNRGLGEKGLVAEKSILEAETELRRAKAETIKAAQRLRNLGMDRAQIASLAEEDEEERNLLRITSPLDGTIVGRGAVPGESVEPNTELCAVADLTQVWVQLDVYEKDVRRIQVGQLVRFTVPGLAPEEFTGRVAWIETELNDRTRTIRVRAEVTNRGGLLRAHMFGRGEIEVAPPRSSLVVPRDAVQWEGLTYVVFVRRRSDEFEPRRVLLGQRSGPLVELAWADLQPEDSVVTTGSFLLKTELMRDAIGAGCCGED